MLSLMAMAFVLNRVWDFAFGTGGPGPRQAAPSPEEVQRQKRVDERRAADEARRERLREHRRSGAQAGRPPDPLGPDQFDPVSGRINWTERLAGPEFRDTREAFEELAKELAGNAQDDELRISLRRLVDELQLQLDEQIQDLPTMEFMESHRFLRRLRDTIRPARGTSN